jgi:hypothetical protein
MRARGWSGGSEANPTYGLAITASDRDIVIDKAWASVVLFLGEDPAPVEVDLSGAFWRSCPEFRHPAIKTWFEELGLAPWRKGSPPSFGVRNIGDNQFTVRRLERKSLI